LQDYLATLPEVSALTPVFRSKRGTALAVRSVQAMVARLAEMIGPEHIGIGCQESGDVGARLSLPVRYTEKTGSDVTAFLDGGDGEMIAVRFDHKRHHVPAVGEIIDIHFPKDRFDIFDAASEERI
jgi:hypothetical protein